MLKLKKNNDTFRNCPRRIYLSQLYAYRNQRTPNSCETKKIINMKITSTPTMLQQSGREKWREKATKLKTASTGDTKWAKDNGRFNDALFHRRWPGTCVVPASIVERNARPHRCNRRRDRQESIIESLARTWKRGSLRSDYAKLPLWGLLPLCPLYHRFKTTLHRNR